MGNRGNGTRMANINAFNSQRSNHRQTPAITLPTIKTTTAALIA